MLLVLTPPLSPGEQTQPLPRAFQILKLGGQFDPNSPQVSTFSDEKGNLSYVWTSPEDRTSVNVELVGYHRNFLFGLASNSSPFFTMRLD